ncbi:MAG: alpha/beta fold hydrolase [Rhodobacteraceae bacterium]|nr:alpha/beta fold hydrolase [Paracoccaceae bacterium]
MEYPGGLKGWPMAEASRMIQSKPHRWHVQIVGPPRAAPDLLFLHGAGATTHSWAGLIDRLKSRFRCIALDLPGHGFTRLGTRFRSGLRPMAEDVARLIAQEGWQPQAIIGHSAGAAVALQLARHMNPAPQIIGLNPALENFEGFAGWLFPVMAKALALNPLTALAFSAGPNPGARAQRLIEGTGSHPPPEMMACYTRLIADRQHIDGTLTMMSQWALNDLLRALPEITAACHFITAAGDLAVPPAVAARAEERMQNTRLTALDRLGHLAHEENPDLLAGVIQESLTLAA